MEAPTSSTHGTIQDHLDRLNRRLIALNRRLVEVKERLKNEADPEGFLQDEYRICLLMIEDCLGDISLCKYVPRYATAIVF